MHAGHAGRSSQDHFGLYELRTELSYCWGKRWIFYSDARGYSDVSDHPLHKLPHAPSGTPLPKQIQAFAYAKKYHSYTKYQASFCLYYSLFYIINACCLVYMVHGSTK
jgi:hypothetical protein